MQINLFEYKEKSIPPDISEKTLSGLDAFLQDIWNKRPKDSKHWRDGNQNLDSKQKFISFMQGTIQAQNYVGVIHYEDVTINILPKIFHTENWEHNESFISTCCEHILWWLNYCKKIRFPNYQSSLSSHKNDFFEILIYLFSRYTLQVLNDLIFQHYVELEEETSTMKGRLHTSAYINENISTGKWHKFQCVYEEFTIDNKFNRIVKYVTTLLHSHSKDDENKKNLSEILFLLDEVSDTPVRAEDCEQVHFNVIYDDLNIVLNYCKLFLNNSISFNYKDELQLFAFLLPMEYVFEDFVAGFMDEHMQEHDIHIQRTKNFDEDENYTIQPDLRIEKNPDTNTNNGCIIADTKYKVVYFNNKKDISQSDLYQMLSYAVRFKAKQVILLYPQLLDEILNKENNSSEDDIKGDDIEAITIKEEFSSQEITISFHKLPIIDRALFAPDTTQDKERKATTIAEKFENITKDLKKQCEDIYQNF